MHTGAIKEGQNVLLIDDLIATGGTLAAGVKLVEQVTSLSLTGGFHAKCKHDCLSSQSSHITVLCTSPWQPPQPWARRLECRVYMPWSALHLTTVLGHACTKCSRVYKKCEHGGCFGCRLAQKWPSVQWLSS